MADTPDSHDEEDFDEYFSEIIDGADLTGLEPKFVKIPALSMPPADLAALSVVQLIEMYRACRDQLATDRKGYKTRESNIKTHLSIISMLLRDKGDALGVDSFATPMGTAFRKTTEKFPIGSWDNLVEYIKRTGNFHILQKRLSSLAAKEIRSTDGALPDGVDVLTEVEFSVRSPTARKSKTSG